MDPDNDYGIMGGTGVYGIFDNKAPGLNTGNAFWGVTRQGDGLAPDIPAHRGA
jgi:hypothetical protein